MLLVEHRVNTLAHLRRVPPEHGVEVDVRDYAEAHRADYLMLDARTIALRPQLADLLDPANAPPALTLIYRDEGETVVVYKINH